MATCPAGHQSAATDFCDTCGRRMGAPPQQPAVREATAEARGPADTRAPEACPVCQAPRTGRFCENCRHDFAAAPAGGPPVWTAVITADRDYFDSMQFSGPGAGTGGFPAGCPAREIRLTGPQMLIGRRGTAGGDAPDIDLAGPPADAGVSHRHALLICGPDGGWALADQDSTNGTQLNGADVQPNVPAALHDGDRIAVGRWTVLTIRVR